MTTCARAAVVRRRGGKVRGKLCDAAAGYLTRPAVDFGCYGLVAEPEKVARRIAGDRRFRDTFGRLADIRLNELIPTTEEVQLVDTCASERGRESHRPAGDRTRLGGAPEAPTIED